MRSALAESIRCYLFSCSHGALLSRALRNIRKSRTDSGPPVPHRYRRQSMTGLGHTGGSVLNDDSGVPRPR